MMDRLLLDRLVPLSLLLLLSCSSIAQSRDDEDNLMIGDDAAVAPVEYESYGGDIGFINAEPMPYEGDPFEGINRAMLSFNDVADRYLLLPIVTGYKYVTPDPVERGVDNFFANLDDVGSAANALLQLKFVDASIYTGRFVTNTTIGFLGIWDAASEIGLTRLEGEDFGQTLGYYGVPEGPYLMLPFFGPSTMRDAPARYFDSYVDYASYVDHVPTRNSMMGIEILNMRSSLIQAEAFITGDRYTFIRDAYLQRRQYLVLDGKLPENESFDTFGGDWGDGSYDDSNYESYDDVDDSNFDDYEGGFNEGDDDTDTDG